MSSLPCEQETFLVSICVIFASALLWIYLKANDKEKRDHKDESAPIHVMVLYCSYTSHRYWARTYSAYSEHTVSSMAVRGSQFKWRMQSAAIAFSKRFIQIFFDSEFNANHENKNEMEIECDIKLRTRPDVVMVDDLIDLNLFSVLMSKYSDDGNGRKRKRMKYVYFMHENQLTIPWSPTDRDCVGSSHWMYGYQHFKCQLGADEVWWNSCYHAQEFLLEVPRLIRNKGSDDWTPLSMVNWVEHKSRKRMYVPMDFKKMEAVHSFRDREQMKEPVILWNARWEFDKNPEMFLCAMRHIKKMKNISFKLVVLGESFSVSASKQSVFGALYEELEADILQFGFVESYSEYVRWLRLSDILVMTSKHEFFGIALMESMYSECIPILPNNLVYPEHFESFDGDYPYFYRHSSEGDLVKKLRQILQKEKHEMAALKKLCKQIASKYDAHKICKTYDEAIRDLVR